MGKFQITNSKSQTSLAEELVQLNEEVGNLQFTVGKTSIRQNHLHLHQTISAPACGKDLHSNNTNTPKTRPPNNAMSS